MTSITKWDLRNCFQNIARNTVSFVNLDVTSHFLSYIADIIARTFTMHKHSCNTKTLKVMHKHLYVINFNNKPQTTRTKQVQITDLEFSKTCI